METVQKGLYPGDTPAGQVGDVGRHRTVSCADRSGKRFCRGIERCDFHKYDRFFVVESCRRCGRYGHGGRHEVSGCGLSPDDRFGNCSAGWTGRDRCPFRTAGQRIDFHRHSGVASARDSFRADGLARFFIQSGRTGAGFLASFFFQLDFSGLFRNASSPVEMVLILVMVVISFSRVDMFDTVGTLLGTAKQARMLDENGEIP